MSKRPQVILKHDPDFGEKLINGDERRLRQLSPFHWHNYIELEFIISGQGEQMLNGRHYYLKKGCVSILRRTDYHNINPIENLVILNLAIKESVLPNHVIEQLWRRSSDLFIEFDADAFDVPVGIARLLIREAEERESDIGYCQDLLCALFKKLLGCADGNAPTAYSTPIERTLLWLHSNFRDSPSLAEAAEIAHYSRMHFCKVFNRDVGITYNEYLTELKLNYAKELLLTTDLDIEYLALKSGFNTGSTFRRAFRERYGISPSEYRALYHPAH